MDIQSQLGEEIGKGGFGTVYTMKDNPQLCIKKSNKKSNCRVWSNEYHKIIKINEILSKNTYYKRLKYVKIIKPTQFIEESSGDCFMIMNRVYRPINILSPTDYKSLTLSPSTPSVIHSKTPENKNSQKKYDDLDTDSIKPTLQALFGMKKNNQFKKSQRGEFIGLDKLQSIFNENELKTIAAELGIMMALLHFIAKNDAFDIELYVGTDYMDKKLKIYISDFDLSEEILEYTDDIIEDRICWSLQAMPYFPSLSSNEALYTFFQKGYRKIAKNNEIVDKIFDCYTL